MNKKQLVDQLNNQKGITGADIIIAMLIILTTIGVIGAVYANLVIGSKEIDRKTGATRIATNILENIDMLYYDEIESSLKTKADNGEATLQGTTYIIQNTSVFNTKIPKGYSLEIDFKNPSDRDLNFVKKVTIKVKYKVDGQDEDVILSKVLEREVIRECNSPQFTEEYIRQIIPSETEYVMYSESAIGVQAGVKIICPIQYDKSLGKYKIVENTDSIWYSYSNKEWAHILVLESNECENNIDSTTKTVTNTNILNSENSYIWIPRFGVKNGGNLFGDTIFKYKDTDIAITSSYDNNERELYNYLKLDNPINWSTQGISFETDDTVGKWSKYSDLSTTNTDAYYLNHSQYGPMIEY